jgi:hypothetical protein
LRVGGARNRFDVVEIALDVFAKQMVAVVVLDCPVAKRPGKLSGIVVVRIIFLVGGFADAPSRPVLARKVVAERISTIGSVGRKARLGAL